MSALCEYCGFRETQGHATDCQRPVFRLRPHWSAPHTWDEAHALGFTEYQWAMLEVQRAHVEALENK